MRQHTMYDILTTRFPNVPTELVREYVDGVFEHEDPITIENDNINDRVQDFLTYRKYRPLLRDVYIHG